MSEEEEIKAQMDAFLAEFKELSTKYKMTFRASLDFTPEGIIPILQVIKPKE